jgi:hypothetical protein
MKKLDQKKTPDFYRINIRDLILVLFIVLLTAGTVIAAKQDLNESRSNVPEASVFHEGHIIREFRIDKDQEISLLDGKMCLEVKGKKLRIKKSDCSHQTCVHMGWIHYPGETLACMPHKILIRINQEDSPVVDAVIY